MMLQNIISLVAITMATRFLPSLLILVEGLGAPYWSVNNDMKNSY